jgi:hypothetical protein
VLEKNEKTRIYCARISKVISGVIRKLFDERTCTPEDQTFRALALFYALPHVPEIQVAKLQSVKKDISPYPVALGRRSGYDYVTCLLQWCHRMILTRTDFLEKLNISIQIDSRDIQRSAARALEKPSPRTIPTEIESLSGENIPQGMAEQEVREEQWNLLALLQVELFAHDPEAKPFLSNLVDEVAKRLKTRETRSLGNSPPWGYRCLDHSLQIELAIANYNLKKVQQSVLDTVQNAYAECSYFLQSNLSFLTSWDSTDPSWLSKHWDFDCSSLVNSSFLAVATLDWSRLAISSEGGLKSSSLIHMCADMYLVKTIWKPLSSFLLGPD